MRRDEIRRSCFMLLPHYRVGESRKSADAKGIDFFSDSDLQEESMTYRYVLVCNIISQCDRVFNFKLSKRVNR